MIKLNNDYKGASGIRHQDSGAGSRLRCAAVQQGEDYLRYRLQNRPLWWIPSRAASRRVSQRRECGQAPRGVRQAHSTGAVRFGVGSRGSMPTSRATCHISSTAGTGSLRLRQTENAYYRAVADGTLPTLCRRHGLAPAATTSLLLDASVKRPWSIGVGGWITSSSNSMLYLNLGFHTLSLNSLDVSIGGWIGQSYYAGMLSARFSLRTRVPSFLSSTVCSSVRSSLTTRCCSTRLRHRRSSLRWTISPVRALCVGNRAQDARHREPCGWRYS